MRRDLVSLALALCLPRSRSLLWLEAEGRQLHGDVTRRGTYFLRGRPGWYLEETAWRRKAGHLQVEAESPSEDTRCAAACSAGEAQWVEEVAPDGVARTRAPFERATPGRVRIVLTLLAAQQSVTGCASSAQDA